MTPQTTKKLIDAGGVMLGRMMPAPCNAAMVTDPATGQDVAPTVAAQVTLVHDKPTATGSFITAPMTALPVTLDTVIVYPVVEPATSDVTLLVLVIRKSAEPKITLPTVDSLFAKLVSM